MDEEALAAGAEAGAMYTDEMILRREQLRSDESVNAALQTAWDRMKEARRVSGDGGDNSKDSGKLPEMGGGQMGDTISRDSFVIMSRKLYLYFTALRFDGYIDARERLAETERDFAHDSGGKEHIDEADFCRSFFQLADVHTETVDAKSYARARDELRMRHHQREWLVG